MDWRAQSGINKRGDEETVDDWSDEEGPPDTYPNRRLRKDVTNLIRGDADRLRARLQSYLAQFYSNVYIGDPKDSTDGRLYFPVEGASENITDFIKTVRESDFAVDVMAGNKVHYDKNGVPETSYDITIVHDPASLVNEYFDSRYYTRKAAFSLFTLTIGIALVMWSWRDISRFFHIPDVIISTLLVASLAAATYGAWSHAVFGALWSLFLMVQVRRSNAYSLLPPTLDMSGESLYTYWLPYGLFAAVTILYLSGVGRRKLAHWALDSGINSNGTGASGPVKGTLRVYP
ncbi:MAG: hypothetical protein LC650_04265 [Actinobacteria bacterium]|nr:hypothetical protein [Actinomycetota bacterium]